MAIAATSGTKLLVVATETDLFSEVTSTAFHSLLVFVEDIVAGEDIIFRVYVRDEADTTARIVFLRTIEDAQTDEPTIYIPPVVSRRYRVSAEQIGGTGRTVSWDRFETT